MPFCICCRSSNVHFGPVKVPNGLPARGDICGICVRHQGDGAKARQRDKDHREQWEHDLELVQERHSSQLRARSAEIAELRATISELEETLIARPRQVVHENLDQATVDEALRKRDQAFRSRDCAYGLVAELRCLHHDTGRGTCKCGEDVRRCAVTQLLDEDGSFIRWEADQIRRWHQGFDHALPPGHPALINPRWSPGDAVD
jgi:hypothetical protein